MTIGLYTAFDCYNKTGGRLEGSNLTHGSQWAKTGTIHCRTPGTSSLSSVATPWLVSRTLPRLLAVDASPIAARMSTSWPRTLAPASGAVKHQSPRASGASIYPWAAQRIPPKFRTSALADQRS
ncbi:hypothetical protein NL676_014152 [Syzygium grande]|nr:hypothetical protein NL676_014152 [Syzygium grande]